jgi:hypothetical protein
MNRDLRHNLRSLRSHDQLTADPVWVAETKQTMLAQLQYQRSHAPSTKEKLSALPALIERLVPKPVQLSARPIALMIMVLAVIFGGYGVRQAAAKSLPGDTLYKLVKRPTEQIELALTKEDQKPKKLLELAKKRSDEIKQLAEQKKQYNKSVSKEHVSEAVASASAHIAEAKEHLETLPKDQIVDFAVELSAAKKNLEETIEHDVVEVVSDDQNDEQDELSSEQSQTDQEEHSDTGVPEVIFSTDPSFRKKKTQIDPEIKKQLDETNALLQEVETKALESVLLLDEEELQNKKEQVKVLVEDQISTIKEKKEQTQKGTEEVVGILEQQKTEEQALVESPSTTPAMDEDAKIDAMLDEIKKSTDVVSKNLEVIDERKEDDSPEALKLTLQEVKQLKQETELTKKQLEEAEAAVLNKVEESKKEEQEIPTESEPQEEETVTDEADSASTTSENPEKEQDSYSEDSA